MNRGGETSREQNSRLHGQRKRPRGRSPTSLPTDKRRKNQPRSQPVRSQKEQQLLSFRSDFKTKAVSLVNIETQRNFLQGCLHLGLTSPGLRIRLNCMTARPDLTNVREEFKEHIHQCERGTMQLLVHHLTKSAEIIDNQLRLTMRNIRNSMVTAPSNELMAHHKFLSATITNIQADASWRHKE